MSESIENLNIAIIPPPALAKKAIGVSERFGRRGGLFVLDNRNFFVHLTLYMFGAPKKSLGEIQVALDQLSTNEPALKLRTLKHRFDDGWVHVAFRRSRNITGLATRVIEIVNPLREGVIRARDKEKFNQYTKEEQKNLDRYGFISVGDLYIPHITFTKMPKLEPDIFSDIATDDYSFTAERIGLFELGEHGTCRRLIREFELQPQNL